MRTTKDDATHTDSDYLRTICTCPVDVDLPLMPAAQFCVQCSRAWDHTWQSTFFNLQCLVRSWPFTGTHRFLAGLFTFLSRQPVVVHLRASEKNWFRTSTAKKKKKKKIFCVVLVTLLSCLLSLYPSSIQFAYIHLHF